MSIGAGTSFQQQEGIRINNDNDVNQLSSVSKLALILTLLLICKFDYCERAVSLSMVACISTFVQVLVLIFGALM